MCTCFIERGGGVTNKRGIYFVKENLVGMLKKEKAEIIILSYRIQRKVLI